jgi:O-acetyl-ADP-ribose deacetylase (regulator of RNase III)
MIAYVTGDMLANPNKPQAYAHGVNCLGVMGAGVAKALRAKYPAMFEAYRDHCANIGLQPGDVFTWTGREPDVIVFNVATQRGFGRGVQATLPAILDGLIMTRRLTKAIGIRSIAMPRIGCGLGGLSWADVRPIVVDVFKNWGGVLYVHSLDSEAGQ